MEEKFSNGFAKLRFDIRKLSAKKIQKIHHAANLLSEVGIFFDEGSDEKFIDWEFDWSLVGATVEVRPITCMQCKKELKDPIWLADPKYPFCNKKCVDKYLEKKKQSL